MKKIYIKLSVLVCFYLLLIFSISGCGLKNVSTKQIIDDLNAKEEINSCLKAEFVPDYPYKIESCQVTREQFNEEEKEDIIICSAVASNDYVEISMNVDLLYTYYDKGGWVLEDMSFEITDIKALKKPDLSMVEAKLTACTQQDIYYYIKTKVGDFELEQTVDSTGQKLTISSVEWTDDRAGVLVHCSHELSDGTIYYGYYEMAFGLNKYSGANEWYFPDRHSYFDFNVGEVCYLVRMRLTDCSRDYNKIAIGEFVNERDGVELIIKSITESTITYSFHTENIIECALKEGENLTATFDPKYGIAVVDTAYGKCEIVYKPGSDEWEYFKDYNGHHIFFERRM